MGDRNEDRWSALVAQADVYMRGRNGPRLRATARSLVELDPLAPEGYASLAEAAWIEHDDFEDAVRWQRAALARDPEDVELLCRLGVFLTRCLCYREADDVLRSVVARTPTWSYAWTQLAELHLWWRNEPELTEALDCALEHDPENTDALLLRAQAAQQFSGLRPDEATIALFHEAIATDPEEAWGHALLGAEYMARREWASAERHLREAVRLRPDREEFRQDYEDVRRRRFWLFRPLSVVVDFFMKAERWFDTPTRAAITCSIFLLLVSSGALHRANPTLFWSAMAVLAAGLVATAAFLRWRKRREHDADHRAP